MEISNEWKEKTDVRGEVPLSKVEQLDKESLSGHEPDVCEEPISLLVHVESVGHVHVQGNNTWPVNLTRG